MLRRTPSTPTDSDKSADRFWDVTKAYYKTYFDGNFYTYFGDKLSKPTVSLTISDTDIVHSAIVFLELILDEISGDPILLWQGPDGKIYPGGTQNRPSLVSIRNITTIPSIPSGPYGCGMNVHKANAVRYLANTFSKAAATESSLTIKSVGSIEIGLGIVGKVNIGDNSTLTLLIQGIVSEIVSRLTVILAVPVLEAIDYEQQPSLRAISGRTEPAVLRRMISPFVSSNVAAF